MIKGIFISGNGQFAAIHYGNTEIDNIKIINFNEKSQKDFKLKQVYSVKSSFHITDDGFLTVLDSDNIVNIAVNGKVVFRIIVPKINEGFSSVSFNGKIYAVSYTKNTGAAKLIVFKKNGDIIFSKEFRDSFLDTILSDNLLFLRGSHNIYCYSIHY